MHRLTFQALIAIMGTCHVKRTLGAFNHEIEDDGRGFDPARSSESSMGLTSMRGRVKLLGGELEIMSGDGGPTLVTATLRRWRRPASAAAAYTSPPVAAKVSALI